ncbi:hypothetical protein, conserved [Trypanosoma brucei brucei TREU927]|uniref:Uncharacterized protein n=1 Tax=Trypanosoma brucei brucei (strain 927/4 GUTat10.1) TaxID=185431 RepID=Q388F3_TRYB2|nr:hypothetical protein, conserved [Trypanosoma brucei brucei TREU927]EAN78817.1 hypothetical protein, conserved [Trypanosoma brucei brucei TREU927]
MLREQCKDFCRCSYCEKKRSFNGTQPFNITLPHSNCHTKDELYVKALNDTLRGKSLKASMKNSYKFEPDEMLLSTRGNMARAALTVPVRRRDRLQELLILENRERLRTEQELRRERLRSGLTLPDEDVRLHDQSVGTDGQELVVEGKSASAEQQPVCSADEDLREALQTIKNVTDGHKASGGPRPLSVRHIEMLRELVRKQDKKTKKMVAECPEDEHLCGHCFAVNAQGKHECQVPPADVLRDSLLPSVRGKQQRFNFSSHPYGSGVVWLPLNTAGDRTALKEGASQASGVLKDSYANSNAGAQGNVEDVDAFDAQDARSDRTNGSGSTGSGEAAAGEPNAQKGGTPPSTNKADESGKQTKEDESAALKSGTALWRTTNQETSMQMNRYLEFKKLHDAAAQVYAESAVRRPASTLPAAAN